MEESTAEQEIKSLPKRVVGRVTSVVKEIASNLNPTVEKIPIEDINSQTVAATIDRYLGNPVRKKFKGDRWANSFSIVDVLANAGYVSVWNDTDYAKRLPEAYQKTRVVLLQLVQEGGLETLQLEEPDINGERIYYKVVNEEILKDCAQSKAKTKPT